MALWVVSIAAYDYHPAAGEAPAAGAGIGWKLGTSARPWSGYIGTYADTFSRGR